MSSPYETLAGEFEAFLNGHGITLSPATQLDALAAMLSNQLLLFAGPSGTGKSTLARLLAAFFSTRVYVLDGQPGLIRPHELLGYATTLRPEPAFSSTEHTGGLLALAETPSGAAADDPPTLIVEEGNLSPLEGYLNAFLHGLAGTATREVAWPAHSYADAIPDVSGHANVPRALSFAPWPRVLTTINVDAGAPAPANSVVARGAVLLLEPPELSEAIASADGLFIAGPRVDPPGRGIDLDPRAALTAARHNRLEEPLRDALGAALGHAAIDGRNLVSPQVAQKALLYLAAYDSIAEHADDPGLVAERRRDGAENALLHYVLPVLDPVYFGTVVESARDGSRPGGLLRDRLSRLRTTEAGLSALPDDFWSGLS